MKRRAIIDVGTNSVKLLVAEVQGRRVYPFWEGSRQTRLGHRLYEAGWLQPESIRATAEAVAYYAAEARHQQAQSIRLIATSAAREARNAGDLIDALREASGVLPEIISGEQEAEWAFAGVTSTPELAEMPLLVLDVGGGSTEFILGQDRSIDLQRSFPLGSVRLFEHCAPGDHPGLDGLQRCQSWLRDFFNREVKLWLEPGLRRQWPERVVGVGGTTAILALMRHQRPDFDRALIESTVLAVADVVEMVRDLWNLPLTERRQIPGLPPERADVILTGAAIYSGILEHFHFADLRISTRGLRHGALLE